MPTRSHFPNASTALLLIDVINPFDFDGGRAFARKALPVARAIARLRERARRAGLPVVYVNDNFGKWRSDAAALVERCGKPGMPGAPIVDLLAPGPSDYFVLKTALSGFFQSPLETMLRLGGVQTVILTGFAADICVLFTAADAHMRDFRLVVPRDCVGAKSNPALRRSLELMERVFHARTSESSCLRLAARR